MFYISMHKPKLLSVSKTGPWNINQGNDDHQGIYHYKRIYILAREQCHYDAYLMIK